MTASHAALSDLYRPSLSLLTDLYQLTMAYGYWKTGRLDDHAVFHLTFRSHPFDGGYTLVAGLQHVIDLLSDYRFDDEQLTYLATLTGNDGKPLFESAFFDYLRHLTWTCDIDAMPEGTVAFPHEPLVRVSGPILQCQLLETPLLTLINFQTLIATKAARICQTAGEQRVLEFGLRRAQGIDGALTAARAAYIGGCAATSNVMAGKLLNIPVAGTHAHSWVMSFETEREAFGAYADASPNNCIFLVDTYASLPGVKLAAEVGEKLRAKGHEMIGIRLDSGDLAYLSTEARRILDEAGFPDASIVVSGDLDEHVIESLKKQGAPIDVWGVGTRLVTGHDQPSLGGVYKLSAIRGSDGVWHPRIKLSEQAVKTSTPGCLQVRRYHDGEYFDGDMIFNEHHPVPRAPIIVDPGDATRRKRIDPSLPSEDLLVPIMRGGQLVYDPPGLDAIRTRTKQQLAALHPSLRRLLNPHAYPAGFTLELHDLKARLILEARNQLDD